MEGLFYRHLSQFVKDYEWELVHVTTETFELCNGKTSSQFHTNYSLKIFNGSEITYFESPLMSNLHSQILKKIEQPKNYTLSEETFRDKRKKVTYIVQTMKFWNRFVHNAFPNVRKVKATVQKREFSLINSRGGDIRKEELYSDFSFIGPSGEYFDIMENLSNQVFLPIPRRHNFSISNRRQWNLQKREKIRIWMSEQAFGTLIHEFSHFLELDLFPNSFTGELLTNGESVSSSLTIHDKIPSGYYKIPIDDEGTKTSDVCLVQQGDITGVLSDRLNSSIYEYDLTGSGRYNLNGKNTSPRITNLVIEPGDDCFEEEVLYEMKTSVLIDNVTQASCNSSGKVVFYSNKINFIDGRSVSKPTALKITFDMVNALNSIELIFKERRIETYGTCEKYHENTITSTLSPSALLNIPLTFERI